MLNPTLFLLVQFRWDVCCDCVPSSIGQGFLPLSLPPGCLQDSVFGFLQLECDEPGGVSWGSCWCPLSFLACSGVSCELGLPWPSLLQVSFLPALLLQIPAPVWNIF